MSKTVTVPEGERVVWTLTQDDTLCFQALANGAIKMSCDGRVIIKTPAAIFQLLAAAQQEDQRESNSNPSPSTGQSKQGLTVSHTDAPTPKQQARIGFDRQASHAEGRYVCEAEQKLLDEYAACFDEPTDAEMLAETLSSIALHTSGGYISVHRDILDRVIAALRAKDNK
jgi:hypothetical protein